MRYDDAEEMLMMLERIPDPRHSRGVRYKFAHLLLISIYAVLAGHSEATEIAYYAELNQCHDAGVKSLQNSILKI